MHPRDETVPRHRRPPRHERRRRRPHLRGRPAVVAVAVVLGASLTGVVLAASGPRPDLAPADRGPVGLVGGPSRPVPSDDARPTSGSGERSPTPAAALPGRGPVVRAAAVLRAWDERRAEAWAEGDVAALRDLYVDRAGAADARLLRRYTDRGYRVEGLTTQLLAVEVLDRGPGRWRLRVTDRLADAVAVRGATRAPLSRGRADTHVVVLTRADGGRWRVAAVRAA